LHEQLRAVRRSRVLLALGDQFRDSTARLDHGLNSSQILLELVSQDGFLNLVLFLLRLSTIAQEYEVTVKAFEKLDDLRCNGVLALGDQLVEGSVDAVVYAQPDTVPLGDFLLDELGTLHRGTTVLDLGGVFVDGLHGF
jgi:hypothetical protein